MTDPKEYIKQAFDACEKVRNKKAQLYGHSWRLAHYYTIINIIYSKLNATSTSSDDWDESMTGTLIATYNYAIFALIQSEIGVCNLYDLYNEGDRVMEKVWRIDEEIKAMLPYKDRGYQSAWILCNFDYLFELILIKIARIQYLREAMLGSDDISQQEALKDAFVDIAGYAILCLARMDLDEEKDAEKADIAATQAPKQ